MPISTTWYIHIRIRRVSIHSILTMIENQIRGGRSSAKESIVIFIVLILVKCKGYQDVVYHLYGKTASYYTLK